MPADRCPKCRAHMIRLRAVSRSGREIRAACCPKCGLREQQHPGPAPELLLHRAMAGMAREDYQTEGDDRC